MSIKKPYPNTHFVRSEGRPLDPEAVHERVVADQARIRCARAHWLDVEQTKYRLPRRGRDIYDMPA